MGDASKHFSYSELSCPCGCSLSIDNSVLPIAEMIRSFLGGKPIVPSSACRCVEYNENVQREANRQYRPYSSKSKHMEGIATDWKTDRAKELYDYLDRAFPETFGIGLYSWGVHIDTRPDKARWSRRKHK